MAFGTHRVALIAESLTLLVGSCGDFLADELLVFSIVVHNSLANLPVHRHLLLTDYLSGQLVAAGAIAVRKARLAYREGHQARVVLHFVLLAADSFEVILLGLLLWLTCLLSCQIR